MIVLKLTLLITGLMLLIWLAHKYKDKIDPPPRDPWERKEWEADKKRW